MVAYFKIQRLPTKGVLSKNGSPLSVGSKFTQADIVKGVITYTHTVPSQGAGAFDSFDFSLWDPELGHITAASYNSCMPERLTPTPEDGIFRFQITITTQSPNETVTPSGLSLWETESYKLTPYVFNVVNTGFNPDQIIHTLREPLVNGYISLRGRKTDVFTQADINSGDVVYHNNRLGNRQEVIKLTSCNYRSDCLDAEINFEIKEMFHQTGDNVIYAPAGGTFVWEFQSNRPAALWSLDLGSTEAPLNAMRKDLTIVPWSSYATSSDEPVDTEGRGPGYDKMSAFRNVKETLYWQGGLPTGVYVSSTGFITTSSRTPTSQAGSQPWKLPNKPGSYPFSLSALDPVTGQFENRKYMLIVTNSGLSDGGLASESRDL